MTRPGDFIGRKLKKDLNIEIVASVKIELMRLYLQI